jgi:hypothetical protein
MAYAIALLSVYLSVLICLSEHPSDCLLFRDYEATYGLCDLP